MLTVTRSGLHYFRSCYAWRGSWKTECKPSAAKPLVANAPRSESDAPLSSRRLCMISMSGTPKQQCGQCDIRARSHIVRKSGNCYSNSTTDMAGRSGYQNMPCSRMAKVKAARAKGPNAATTGRSATSPEKIAAKQYNPIQTFKSVL